ncbi:hypothetical protein EJB05_27089, partial [Eragrostis curvula]
MAAISSSHMPGADLRLASLLGLRPAAQRTMLYLGGCAAGSAFEIRNPPTSSHPVIPSRSVCTDSVTWRPSEGAVPQAARKKSALRVLMVCADLSLVPFRAPREDRLDTLVMQGLFGDGAMAVVVGAGAGESDAAAQYLGEGGLAFRPSSKMPALVRHHVERCLADAVAPLGIGGDWNDLFRDGRRSLTPSRTRSPWRRENSRRAGTC